MVFQSLVASGTTRSDNKLHPMGGCRASGGSRKSGSLSNTSLLCSQFATCRRSLVLGVAATFREVAAYSGVDENLPTGGQGIIVPSGGCSTLVILEGGRGLDVRSTVPSKVHVYEFKKKQERAEAARSASNPAEAMRRLDENSWRIFRIKADAPGFLDERDSGSALTFFLVRKVTNGGHADNGATNAKERVALIADSRSDSTMAHEAGHFLGALNAEGKYDSEYGHPEKSQEMLMHANHIRKKIPYAAVLKFN